MTLTTLRVVSPLSRASLGGSSTSTTLKRIASSTRDFFTAATAFTISGLEMGSRACAVPFQSFFSQSPMPSSSSSSPSRCLPCTCLVLVCLRQKLR